jgi:hypothetical protein
MNAQPMEGYESLPTARSYRLLDFEWAEIVTLESFPLSSSCGSGVRSPTPT